MRAGMWHEREIMKISTGALALFLTGVVFLSGCTMRAEQGGRPEGSRGGILSHHEILDRSYTNLAAKAFAEMDWIDAYRFQNKAAQARKGRAIEPDDPKSRSIAVAKDPAIVEAHRILRGYIQGDGFTKAPADLALALAAYDCWIEDAEESEIALTSGPCRIQYQEALHRVEDAYIDAALGGIEKPRPKGWLSP